MILHRNYIILLYIIYNNCVYAVEFNRCFNSLIRVRNFPFSLISSYNIIYTFLKKNILNTINTYVMLRFKDFITSEFFIR